MPLLGEESKGSLCSDPVSFQWDTLPAHKYSEGGVLSRSLEPEEPTDGARCS